MTAEKSINSIYINQWLYVNKYEMYIYIWNSQNNLYIAWKEEEINSNSNTL